jgi:hypothetical protein
VKFKGLISVVCVMLAALGGARLASADFATEGREALIGTELDSPAAPQEDFSGDTSSGMLGTNAAVAGFGNVETCVGSVCTGTPGSIKPVTGYRSVPITAFMPPTLGAEADLLSSPVLATYEQLNIANPYKVFRTTLHLTEGAVAAGITDANNDVANKLMNQRLGQIETLLASEAMPEVKLFVKNTYECIQRRISLLGESSYIAIGNCRNDRMSPVPGIISTGTTFFSGEGARFGDDSPAHWNRTNGAATLLPPVPFLAGGAAYDQNDQIRLTDLLFNEEITNQVNEDPALSLVAYRYGQEFRRRYGDMVWGVATVALPSGSSGGSLNQSARQGTWAVLPEDDNQSEEYQKRIGDNFGLLATLLYGRCQTLNIGTGAVAVSDSLFFQNLPASSIRGLSTVGLTFSPDLLGSFMAELYASSASFGNQDYDCDLTNPVSLLSAGAGSWRGTLRDLAGSEESNSLYRYMYGYSRLLALNQILVEAKTTIRYLDSLSAAANDGAYQEYVTMGKKLIMKSLGNIALDEAIQNSREELASLTNTIAQRQQREAITDGRSFSSPKQEANAS